MSIQQFDLGGGGSKAMYPLMARFMETMSGNAEQIGGNIRSAMIQTEANTQTKEMADQMGGLSLFDDKGYTKPDAMQNLFKLAAAHPLGSQTQAGKSMLEGLVSQVKENVPIDGWGGSTGQPAATSYGGSPSPGGMNTGLGYQPEARQPASAPAGAGNGNFVEAPLPEQGNGSPEIDLTTGNFITGQPGMEAGGAAPAVQTNGQETTAPVDMFTPQQQGQINELDAAIARIPNYRRTHANRSLINESGRQESELRREKARLVDSFAKERLSATKEARLEKDRKDRRAQQDKLNTRMERSLSNTEKSMAQAAQKTLHAEHRTAINDSIGSLEKQKAPILKQLDFLEQKAQKYKEDMAVFQSVGDSDKKVDQQIPYANLIAGLGKRKGDLTQKLDSINALIDPLQKELQSLAKPVGTSRDEQALAWADANPDDPRAKAILQKLNQ